MSEVHEGPADHGTNELLEVAYRFGVAVAALASGAEPPRQRLLVAWGDLGQVQGARSGLWPEPHLEPELGDQVDELLMDLTAAGSIERTLEAIDDRDVALLCQRVVSLAFALQQAVATAP